MGDRRSTDIVAGVTVELHGLIVDRGIENVQWYSWFVVMHLDVLSKWQ